MAGFNMVPRKLKKVMRERQVCLCPSCIAAQAGRKEALREYKRALQRNPHFRKGKQP